MDACLCALYRIMFSTTWPMMTVTVMIRYESVAKWNSHETMEGATPHVSTRSGTLNGHLCYNKAIENSGKYATTETTAGLCPHEASQQDTSGRDPPV